MDKGKVIRYSVIASFYNLFLSSVVYIADWVNDTFFQFKWQNWDLASWWLFIAANLVIFGTLVFLAPYFERVLFLRLNKILIKTNKKVE